MLKEEKAQSSIEYLLLVGGVIVIATTIGLYLKSIPPKLQPGIEEEARRAATGQ